MVMGDERPIPRFTEKIPWVRSSQQGFVTATNEMNWRIFKRYLARLEADNLKIASGEIVLKPGEAFSVAKEAGDYMAMLSDLTGRAGLGPLKELSPALNAGLFSLRFTIGRAISPRHLFSMNPRIRIEAWKNIGSAVAANTAVLLVGKQLGLWDVELDPRSADFMKARIGPVRFDPWGGYQQFATLFARLALQTTKSATTGRVSPANTFETLGRFLESKGSPLVGTLTEIVTRETYTGEPVDPRNVKQWVDRAAPMSIADVIEAASELGLAGTLVGVPSAVGIGTATYGYKVAEATNKSWAAFDALPGVKDLGITLGYAPGTIDITPEKGGAIKLSDDLRADYQRIMGETVTAGLKDLLPTIPTELTPEERKALVTKWVDHLKGTARGEFIDAHIGELQTISSGQPAPTQTPKSGGRKLDAFLGGPSAMPTPGGRKLDAFIGAR